MDVQRRKVERAAEGKNLAVRRNQWIVWWDPDGRNVRPGPGAYFNYFNISIISIISILTPFLQVLFTMKLNEKKQDAISYLMRFGQCLISVLI